MDALLELISDNVPGSFGAGYIAGFLLGSVIMVIRAVCALFVRVSKGRS